MRAARPDIIVAPSLLSADFARLAQHVAAVEAGGAEWLHLDVMDGHFVPNLTIGPVVIEKLRPASRMFFDTHLMITDPRKYAGPFARAGSDQITFHIEAVDSPMAVIEHIRGLGKRVGVSVKPGTPASRLDGVLDAVDMVLVMTVEPGFGGQEFMADMVGKIEELRDRLRPDQRLEVDGGISEETVGTVVRAGADTLVAGSAIFGAADPAAAVVNLRKAAASARGAA